MFNEFRAFINRGNVLDLAVAVVIGAAFGRIVTMFVEGILMPPLGMLLGRVDFASLFLVLDSTKGQPVSLAQAKELGVPVIAYGAFVNEIINFLLVAFAVFLIVREANRRRAPAAAVEVTTKPCPKCTTAIPRAAVRCPACCVDL